MGTVTVNRLSIADVGRCPKLSLSVAHFHPDGSCKCGDRERVAAELAAAQEVSRAARREVLRLRRELETC
jgi:hypothetical protein